MEKSNLLTASRYGFWFLAALMLVVPMLVFPLGEQFVLNSKYLMIVAGTLGLLGLFSWYSWEKKSLTFIFSPLTLPVLSLGIIGLTSSFLSSNYPVEHLIGIGGVLIATAIIAVFGSSLVFQVKNLSSKVLSAAGILAIALTTAIGLQLVGFGPSMLINSFLPVPIPESVIFNLTGSSLIATQLLLVIGVGLISQIIIKKKLNLIQQVAVIATFVGIAIHGWSLLPSQPAHPTLLPYSASYSIAIDVLKQPRTALIGVGPEAFENAYSIFKPNWINGTDFWNVRFTQASSVPFSLLITTGIFGLLSWVWLIVAVYKQLSQTSPEAKPLLLMVAASLALQLFLPLTAVFITFQALLIAFVTAAEFERFSMIEVFGLTVSISKKKFLTHKVSSHSRSVLVVFTAIIALIIASTSYGLYRVYAAEMSVVEGIRAAQNSDAVGVYNANQRAIQLNPFLDTHRRRYAVTNLTIASALSQKTDRTEQENEQFSQLVQQAIREGRAATELDPADSTNWINMSQIYRSLIGAAEGSDQWTVTSYVQAINLDPQNPGLRVELGGVLYGAQNFREATRVFEQAAALKPDYPNAYYNLANSLKQSGRLAEAKTAYQKVLLLIEADSPDYAQTAEELSEVEAALSEQAEKAAADAQSAGSQTGLETNTQPSITSQNSGQSPLESIVAPQDQPLETIPGLENETASESGKTN